MNFTPTQPLILNSSNLTHLSQLLLTNGTYEGEFKDSKKNGLGLFIWKNGDAYFGCWQDDKMHGKGIFCYNTGHYIEGVFDSNFVEGPACLTYPDRSFLKGVFKRGQLDGRALFYQTEKNGWILQDYESGKLKGVYYEGQGKPLSYDFFVNTYGEGFASSHKGDTSDASYTIQVVKKEMAAPNSMGCFELDNGVRHYGIIKNESIEGLGIRIMKNCIEVGKFRNSRLDADGRRLEFGKSIYEGEFIHGKFYGKGVLREWKDRMITTITGIFIEDAVTYKISEERASAQSLTITSFLDASSPRVIELDVRNFEDTFAKDYAKADEQDEDSRMLATTIKEISYAKVISRETVIECQEIPKMALQRTLSKDSLQNSPSRRALMETASHLAKMVNAANNDPYDITTTLQATQGYIDQLKQRLDEREIQRPKRSQSYDRNVEPSFSQVFNIGVEEKSPIGLQRSASKEANRFGNVTINYPASQVIIDAQTSFSSYVNKMNNGPVSQGNSSVSPSLVKRLSSPVVGYAYEQPSTGLNLSPNRVISDDRDIESSERRAESPLLSSSRKNGVAATHKIYTIDTQNKLIKGQKTSKSSSDLHVQVEAYVDKKPEKLVKAYTYVKETSPVMLNLQTKITTDRSTPSVQSSSSSGKVAPSNQVNRPKTPTRNNNQAQVQFNNNIIKTPMESKGSTPKTMTPAPKNSNVKEKNAISSSQKSVQSSATKSPYVRKPSTGNISKNPRMANESPAHVVELDLSTYSQSGNQSNQASAKKETNWSAQKNSYMNEEHYDRSISGSSQRSFNTDKISTGRQSARKAPLISNVVNIDISMFRAETPGVSDNFEEKKSSPAHLKADYGSQTHWTANRLENNNTSSYNQPLYDFKVNERNFPELYGHGLGSATKEEKKVSSLNLTLAHSMHPTNGGGLDDFNLQTFDRRNQESSEEDAHEADNLQVDKHKLMNCLGVGTPSFSLTGNRNIKFSTAAATGETEKRRTNTPPRLARDELNGDPQEKRRSNTPQRLARDELNSNMPASPTKYKVESPGKRHVESPGKRKVESPYKIDVQRQKFSILAKSPTKKENPESPTRGDSSGKNDSSSYDSSKYYPVKKTCQLNPDSHCCGSRCGSGQGSPQKSNSQKGSPKKLNRQPSSEGFKPSLQQFTESGKGNSANDLEGFTAIASKFENLREYFNQSNISANPVNTQVSSEKQEILPVYQYSSKQMPLPQFGLKSGSTTPRTDADFETNRKGKYAIIDEPVDAMDYFASQPENFAARPGLKRPQVVVESKISTGVPQKNVVQKDNKLKGSVNNTRDKSPPKATKGETSHKGGFHNRGSSQTFVQEGSVKDAHKFYKNHFGSEVKKTTTKTPTNSQNHQGQGQIKRLPEEIRAVLNSKGGSNLKGYQVNYKEVNEQMFGSTSGGGPIEGNFKPYKDLERSKSVSKIHNGRDREVHFGY